MQTFILKKLHSKPVAIGDSFESILFGKQVTFTVTEADPSPSVVSDHTTLALEVKSNQSKANMSDNFKTMAAEAEDIRLVDENIYQILQNIVKIYLDDEQPLSVKYRSVLVVGAENSGKTMLLNKLANYIKDTKGCAVVSVSLLKDSSIAVKPMDQPGICLIDDLHAVDETRLKAVTRSVYDMMVNGVLVVSCSNQSINESLHKMHEKIVEIPAMTLTVRNKILADMFRDSQLTEDQLLDIALRTSGFNFDDFARLKKNFHFACFSSEKKGILENNNFKIVRKCLSETKPITLSFASSSPNVKWSDIGGYDHVKKLIHRVVELPMKNPELFKRRGIKPSKVII